MKQRAITGALKNISVFVVIILLLLVSGARADPGFTREDVRTWYWTGHTYNARNRVNSVACADVDGDGATEIVTGGYYGVYGAGVAQLAVWNGATLALEGVTTWYWVGDTQINSIAVGDVDGDGDIEIITGGYYHDGTRDRAQLAVWDSTLSLERVRTWYWVGNTRISSVAVGDVDGDGQVEVVTGGYYNNVTHSHAQLVVWDGATLALERVKTWRWVHTGVSSVAVGDVDGDGQVEVVTGGNYFDGTWKVQLVVWDGATLALEGVKPWYWGVFNQLISVVIDDVDGDGNIEIVTGSYYDDDTRMWAQLCVWNGATLALEGVTPWYWVGYTYLFSVAVGDVDGDGSVEIVTGGKYWETTHDWAQLVVWDGATLALEGAKAWYWVSHTWIESVACGDVDGDGKTEIVTGGHYWDGTRDVAQLCVWGFT